MFLFLEYYSIQTKGTQKGPKSLPNELSFVAKYVDMIDTIQEVKTQQGRVEVDSNTWMMEVAGSFETKGSLSSCSNVDEGSLEAELVAEEIDLQASIVPENLPSPSSELINPTANSLQVFQQRSQWLDKTVYQRDNIAEACEMLGITNQDKPHLSGMRPSTALFEWQPVAIAAFLKMVEDPC